MNTLDWIYLLENTKNNIKTIKSSTCELNIESPATIEEINNIEIQLGLPLPSHFKEVLLHVSKCIKFHWFVDEIDGLKIFKNEHFSDEFVMNCTAVSSKILYSGGIFDNGLWDINKLLEYNELKHSYNFVDEDCLNQYWENSLIFAAHGNGDYFAIDLKYNIGEVIYLSSNYDMNGLRLGKNFITFFNEWIKVGCAGHWGQDFYMLSTKEEPYISSTSANSLLIKKWLKI